MKLIEVKTWPNLPPKCGTLQMYNPKLRDMSKKDILDFIRARDEWVPYGYNTFILSRDIATVFISK